MPAPAAEEPASGEEPIAPRPAPTAAHAGNPWDAPAPTGGASAPTGETPAARIAALEALANDPSATLAIGDAMKNDEDASVRKRAFKLLLSRWDAKVGSAAETGLLVGWMARNGPADQ